jgi:hypothetical protein
MIMLESAQMKVSRLLAVAILVIAFAITSVNIACAQWSAINSGYAVTTNWHGQEVPFGASVTAWAGTNNSEVYQVEFLWKNATDHVIFVNITNLVNYTTPNYPPDAPEEIINWATNSKNAGVKIWYANNTQIPNSMGNWTVQVFFYAPGGHLRGQISDIIKIKATSFHVVPDFPLVGTAGAVVVMLLGLGLFWNKKR